MAYLLANLLTSRIEERTASGVIKENAGMVG